jgi:peptidyl-prolyl cis-trans isomerase A (cyclophilin A)
MQKRLATALIALTLASNLPAQTPAPTTAPVPATPAAKLVRVILTTSAGPIALDLDVGRAPITTGNFLRYVDQKRLDGIAFYRAVKITADFGLVQGGVRNDPKRVLANIAHEPTSKTGLRHTDGTISMARGKLGSANGDFFIIIGTMPSLDADPAAPGDNLGYAAFGKVVEGMDVVRKIYDAPISPTLGVKEGMKGQMIAAPVRILSARRGKAPLVPVAPSKP